MTLTEQELEEARKVLGLSSEADSPDEPNPDEPKGGLPFYCPGCGRAYEYRRQCTGSAEQPHKPIEVVSTDELKGDPENHTAAPNTDDTGL